MAVRQLALRALFFFEPSPRNPVDAQYLPYNWVTLSMLRAELQGRQALAMLRDGTSKKQNSLRGRLSPAPAKPETLDAPTEKPSMMAQKSNPNAPDEVSHLLSIVDALEAVLSLKRSGRARHVLFRADKAAVEQASRRDFKVKHLQQLKTLLGDAIELRWVKPQPTQRKTQGNSSVRDLDLAVRFHVQRSAAPLDANTPPRGRSTTRCQITASSGSPPRLPPVSPSPQPSPSKASLSCERSSQIKQTLLSSLAKHAVATQEQLPKDTSSLEELFNHTAWDCDAWEPVQLADLPERPQQIAASGSGSLGTTPQRCGSTTHSLLTPSPSIRHRSFSTALPPQLTPQSMFGQGASPAATHVSPAPFMLRPAAGSTDFELGRDASVSLADDPDKQPKGLTCRVLFPPFQTPQKQKSESLQPASVSKQPCQTPGKRKRDVSPTSPVRNQSTSDASIFRTPVAVSITQCQDHQRSASKAQRTPGRKCVGLSTPTPSLTSVQTPIKGAQASPAVRRQLISMSTPSRFSDKLPTVQVRTPKATPKGKHCASNPVTPMNDINGPLAHCAAATPQSAQCVRRNLTPHRRSPAVNFGRVNKVLASPGGTKVANAETFYSSPSKSQGISAETETPGKKGSLAFKVVKPVPKQLSPAKKSQFTFKAKKGDQKRTDASYIAASIMDDDMAVLLASNSRKAAEKKIAQDPKNIRKTIEKDAQRALPAIYDVIRAAFQKKQTLALSREECISAIHDSGLHNRCMSSEAAPVFLDCLVKAVPEWATLQKKVDQETTSDKVCISRMCTGVRQKLEIVAQQIDKEVI